MYECVTIVTSLPRRRVTALADGHLVFDQRDFTRGREEPLVVDEYHRAVFPQRRLHQAVGVSGGRRCDHFQAWHTHQPGFEALRMRYPLAFRPRRGFDDQRYAELAAGLEAGLRSEIYQRVEPEHQEIHVRDTDQRSHPGGGGTRAKPDHRGFGHRRVAHARRAELLEEPRELLVRAAETAYVLPQHDHRFVAIHLLAQRARDRLAEEQLDDRRRRFR